MRSAYKLGFVRQAICWVFLVAIAPPALADSIEVELPTIEVMPGLDAHWIAERMSMNGMPMRILSFTSSEPADKVLAFYRGRWKTAGLARIGETEVGGMKSIGMEQRGHYYSVQAQDASFGSEGMLTVSLSPERVRADRTTRFPLASGIEVVSKIETVDLGVRAEVLTLRSPRPVERSSRDIAAALARTGWSRRAGAEEGGVLMFQKDRQHCQIVLQPDPQQHGQTLLQVTWVK